MSRSPKLTVEEAKAEIEFELARKKKIQSFVAAQEEWERVMGGQFTSSEEQQRVSGDILHGKGQIRDIDKRIKNLQAQLDAAS
ncbi:MAG TPA: hypothetical protein VGN12_15495 [Pirellulales bacterium]|jgi:hypothetical protein